MLWSACPVWSLAVVCEYTDLQLLSWELWSRDTMASISWAGPGQAIMLYQGCRVGMHACGNRQRSCCKALSVRGCRAWLEALST